MFLSLFLTACGGGGGSNGDSDKNTTTPPLVVEKPIEPALNDPTPTNPLPTDPVDSKPTDSTDPIVRKTDVPIDLIDDENDTQKGTVYDLPENKAFILPITDSLNSCGVTSSKTNCGLYANIIHSKL